LAGIRFGAILAITKKNKSSLPGILAAGGLRQKVANQIAIAAADGRTAALATAHYVEMKKASRFLSNTDRSSRWIANKD
jgi:alkyl hydroperoxide reductase subunit AhpF